jgi:hypothetical protein
MVVPYKENILCDAPTSPLYPISPSDPHITAFFTNFGCQSHSLVPYALDWHASFLYKKHDSMLRNVLGALVHIFPPAFTAAIPPSERGFLIEFCVGVARPEYNRYKLSNKKLIIVIQSATLRSTSSIKSIWQLQPHIFQCKIAITLTIWKLWRQGFEIRFFWQIYCSCQSSKEIDSSSS